MLQQPLAQLALLLRVRRVQHPLQRAILGDQLQRRLFAHARHAGNVVRRVAHQALHVDHLLRFEAVDLLNIFRRDPDGVRDALFRVENGRFFARELEGVPVAGDEHGLPALALALGGDGAQNVVRLVAGQLQNGQPHSDDQLADNGILGAQLVGHGLAGAFVVGVSLGAQRRRVHIEGHGQLFGLLLLDGLEQHHHKAMHRVGGCAVRRAHRRLKRMERAIHQAVAIQQNDFSGHRSSPLHNFPLYYSRFPPKSKYGAVAEL